MSGKDPATSTGLSWSSFDNSECTGSISASTSSCRAFHPYRTPGISHSRSYEKVCVQPPQNFNSPQKSSPPPRSRSYPDQPHPYTHNDDGEVDIVTASDSSSSIGSTKSVLSYEKSIASRDKNVQLTKKVKKLPDRQRSAMEYFLNSPNGLNWDDLVRSMREEMFIQTITIKQRDSNDDSCVSSIDSRGSTSSLSSRSKRRSEGKRRKARKEKMAKDSLERRVERVVTGRNKVKSTRSAYSTSTEAEMPIVAASYAMPNAKSKISPSDIGKEAVTAEIPLPSEIRSSATTPVPEPPSCSHSLPSSESDEDSFYNEIRGQSGSFPTDNGNSKQSAQDNPPANTQKGKPTRKANELKSPYAYSHRRLLPSVKEERDGNIAPFPTSWDYNYGDGFDDTFSDTAAKIPEATANVPPSYDYKSAFDRKNLKQTIDNLRSDMEESAKDLRFEEAAKLRDQIKALEESSSELDKLRADMEKAASNLQFEEAAKLRDQISAFEESLLKSNSAGDKGALYCPVMKFTPFCRSDEDDFDRSVDESGMEEFPWPETASYTEEPSINSSLGHVAATRLSAESTHLAVSVSTEDIAAARETASIDRTNHAAPSKIVKSPKSLSINQKSLTCWQMVRHCCEKRPATF